MNQTEKLVEALQEIALEKFPRVYGTFLELPRESMQHLQRKAFIEGYKQALESYKNGWVSVEERLPEPCSDVICFTLGGYGVESLLFDGDRKFYNQNTDVERNPTHWQPLPTPPQTKTT